MKEARYSSFLFFTLLLLCNSLSIGQNTFVKIIDIDGLPQYAKQILKFENKYYLSVFNSCGIYVCDGVIEISKDGEIIKETKINNLSNNLKSLTFDSSNNIILYSGEMVKPDLPDDHFIIFKIDKNNLNILDSVFIKDQNNSFVKMFQSGLVSLKNRTLVSGIGRDAENSPAKSLIYFLNPDYTVDTLLTFQFTRGNTSIWEQYVDHDGLLTFHFWYDNFDEYEFRSRIIKINEYKEVVWDWVSPPIKDYIYPFGMQHSEGFSVVSLPDSLIKTNLRLFAINKDKSIRWVYEYPIPKAFNQRRPHRIKEMKNGDILILGRYDDRTQTPIVDDVPYMCRFTKEGKLLWERAYFTDYGAERVSTGWINDMIEHDDGRIMAVGQIREGNVPPYTDILILTTDADGCITPGCGVLNKLNDLISGTEEVVIAQKNAVRVSPNPFDNVLQVKWENNHSESIKVSVFDSMGRLQFSGEGTDGSLDIDTDGWPSGLFFLEYLMENSLTGFTKAIRI